MPIHLCLRNFSAEHTALLCNVIGNILFSWQLSWEFLMGRHPVFGEKNIQKGLFGERWQELASWAWTWAGRWRQGHLCALLQRGKEEEVMTALKLVGPMPLGCTLPCDHQPFGKAMTLEMFQTSGLILEIPLNRSSSFSLLRVECEVAFRCSWAQKLGEMWGNNCGENSQQLWGQLRVLENLWNYGLD